MKYILYNLAIFTSLLTSCTKLVSVETPRNQIVTEQVFADSGNSSSAVLGMYVTMMGGPFSFTIGNGGVTTFTSLYADELLATRNNPNENELYQNSLSRENTTIAELWRNAYTIIYQANAIIEGLENNTTMSSVVKNRFIGESKLVRSFIYFNLCNLFGNVPYIKGTNFEVNTSFKRTSVDSIYADLLKEIGDASQLLPANYLTSGRIRPNKFAALSLLARLHLYLHNWSDAEAISTQIIENPIYSLNQDLSKVFLPGNSESIWQLPPAQPGGFETTEGMQFVPFSASAIPNYILNSNQLNSFEPNDLRRSNWVAENTVGGQRYFYPFKYKLNYSGSNTPKEYYMIFRISEQYLIRAESRARQNNLTGAALDLNKIRRRAGLIDKSLSSIDHAISEIINERRSELFCEWGHRWFDLKRLKLADSTLSLSKSPGWNPTDILFPIPFREILLNPLLTQNPGY